MLSITMKGRSVEKKDRKKLIRYAERWFEDCTIALENHPEEGKYLVDTIESLQEFLTLKKVSLAVLTWFYDYTRTCLHNLTDEADKAIVYELKQVMKICKKYLSIKESEL